jgi:hypothetical protein
MDVDRVTMKAPAFTPKDPELWFVLLEHSFDIAGITVDTTKYQHAMVALDSDALQEARDIIMNPPRENKYEHLKTQIITRLSISSDRRLKRLLESEEMGDRTPSQFLRHLRTLGGTAPDDILRSLWMSRLPQTAQSVVAAQRSLPLDSLAEVADAVVETLSTARPPPAAVYQVDDNELKKLRAEIAELRLAERSRSRSQSRNNSSRYRSGSRSRNRSWSRPNDNPEFCWYHNQFGARARKCSAPCKFASSGNANEGR